MQTLRITSVKVIDSSNIDVTFTDDLTSNLVTSNISIISDALNVPNSAVLLIKVTSNILSINCQPLTPLGAYFLEFKSTPLHLFESLNGEARISEDGVSNKFLIIAPLDSDNPIKTYLDTFLYDNIYKEDDTALVRKYIKGLAIVLSRALYDIRQVKNENYLTFNVADEQKFRGSGPFDRLNEESAYEVVRVGRTPTGTNAKAIFTFDSFPTYPITLQRKSNIETLVANSVDELGTFNINSLVFNFSNSVVTRVNKITFTFNTITPIYVYDIARLGYQIKDSRYDQDFGFSYLQLEENQIRISDEVLKDPLFALNNIISVSVEYETKNLGTVIDATTVTPYSTLNAIREVLPPIINVFSLKHAPITDISNKIPTLGGIIFRDPNSNTGAPHPAFVTEIPFRLNALPSTPGTYSIDYELGTVYVYGNDNKNDGTGPYPPLATYKYRFIYKSEIDYIYDNDLRDIVALPIGSLIGETVNISFGYEEVLIPGTDYKAPLHQESLDERINNKLLALNVLRVNNSPITNVFRVYNETSGEIYTLDRWNDDKIYFRYNVPPRIIEQLAERASFTTVSNELLFVNTTLTNLFSLRIFKIYLNNNTIVSSTEDAIASSFNTSLVFSDGYVFNNEKWFSREFDESTNLTRLQNVGEYMVDYVNGIAYVAVYNTQGLSIGTVTYKNNFITTQLPHIISVEDLYYRISPLEPKNKLFSYTNFTDNTVDPETLDASDELFLNNTSTAPYQIYNGDVGIFLGASFSEGVTNQVKFVRTIFEYSDVSNSIHPINFAPFSSSNGFNITIAPITKQVFGNVQHNILDGYFVTIDENVPYLSSNITYNFSVTRLSDGYALWNGAGTIVVGNPLKLILPGINSPMNGDYVNITYTFTINNLSRLVVDYNKGDYFIDYTYLNDEIIVSYEYGDNVLDFRQNMNLPADTEYYVSYKAGALRDALLKNFGTLVNVPELAVFDVDFNRERYREALIAALTSFVQGPTLAAIKNIGKTISHIEPEVVESAFVNWSLGSSLLSPETLAVEGEFELLPAKYSLGALINKKEQAIQCPVNSNLRLEDGTFETWIIPQWNGLDNQSTLTFNITKDNIAIAENDIFIGVSEYHPTIINGNFSLDKNSSVSGIPNTNKDGIFIYYDKDASGNFDRWFVRVIDGYVSPISSSYKFKITSTGNFYDSKSITLPKPSNLTTFTGTNSLTVSITGGLGIDEGVTFLSDQEHYILDFGEMDSKNRFSIYKDVSGYMNFRIFDRDKVSYAVSADVSSWRVGDMHHVAASWKLNTNDSRDEMHLFLDGIEVPNIIKYGQKLQPYLHEKFRTVDPEEIIGLSARDIVASIDLHTTIGSNVVTSSLNFGTYNIFIGDTIIIDEVGFSSTGYTITAIAGQTLTLSATMPTTLTDARFSINRTSFTVTSAIDTASNISVSTIHAFVTGTDGYGTINSNIVSSIITNFNTSNVLPGYLISIDGYSSLEIVYTITQVFDGYVRIDGPLAISFGATTFKIYSNIENEIPGTRATRPSYSITKDSNFNNILTVSNNVFAKDLLLIRTLGINSRTVKKQYYVWSDNQENILMTRLPPPISLDEAKITKIIVPAVAVGPANSILLPDGYTFNGNNLPADPTTNSQVGRTININIAGNNVDFSTPVLVTINGVVNFSTINEAVSFSDYGTIGSVNKFISVNYIQVVAKSKNSNKNALTVTAKEKYSITHGEDSGLVPVVRYSYYIGGGTTLQNDGYGKVRDENFLFSGADTNNYLVISSPNSVAGYYIITGFSTDRKSLTIIPTNQATALPLPAFTNGVYQILNVNDYRSGLQNGFFTLETGVLPSQAYFLEHGFYELEYSTYTRIKIDLVNNKMFIGSDFHNTHHLNGIIDQVKVYSTMLTDTRIGETIPSNQRSVTKDFNSLKALKSDVNTLMLVSFDEAPFTNSASFYINSNKDKRHFQSSTVINENFGNSVVILNKPIVVSNDGILDTRKQGTIEFWMSPLFDTGNDPNTRFYFDAFGAVVEEAVSVSNVAIKLSSPASSILSVKLQAGDPRVDYFAGGKIEIDTQHAIQELHTSISDSTVIVDNFILQVITVKIVGDLVGTDYFEGGSVGNDLKTIYLGKTLPSGALPLIVTYQTTENKNVIQNTQVIRLNKKLPYQNSKVVVNYIPQGLQGDRIAIFKDPSGYMNFAVTASGTDYVVRAPTRWAKNTWHRVKATYKLNSGKSNDEIKLYLDGYQYANIIFGSNIVFGNFPMVWGASVPGGITDGYADGYAFIQNIRFKDPINDLFIGSQYTGEGPIFSLLDNFRISDISRPIYSPYGEPLDVNYSTNLDTVFPVTEDLFTTYLMNYDKMIVLNDDFAILKNRETGIFDFSVNILDSLGIVNSSIKSKEVLEKLIKVLKPANSRVFITYTR